MATDSKEEKKQNPPPQAISNEKLSSDNRESLVLMLETELRQNAPASIVIRGYVEKLKEVKLKNVKITDVGAKMLADSMKACDGFNTFVLEKCTLGEEALAVLLLGISTCADLHTLGLRDTTIDTPSSQASVVRRNRGSVPSSSQAFSSLVANCRKLHTVIFSGNLPPLIQALSQPSTLHTLELHCHGIKDTALQGLAKFLLEYRTLRVLRITCNDPDVSFGEIIRRLPEIELEKLYLNNSRSSEERLQEFTNAFYRNNFLIDADHGLLHLNNGEEQIGKVISQKKLRFHACLCLARNRKLRQMLRDEFRLAERIEFLSNILLLPKDIFSIIGMYCDDIMPLESMAKLQKMDTRTRNRFATLAGAHEKQLIELLNTYIGKKMTATDFFMQFMSLLPVSNEPHEWQLISMAEGKFHVVFESQDAGYACLYFLRNLLLYNKGEHGYSTSTDALKVNMAIGAECRNKSQVAVRITSKVMDEVARESLQALTQTFKVDRAVDNNARKQGVIKKQDISPQIPIARTMWGSSFASPSPASTSTSITSTSTQTTSTSLQPPSSDKEESVKKDESCLLM